MTWYQPRHFVVGEHAHLLAVLRAHPFATLVSVHDGAPAFTHLPLEAEASDAGLRLLGHVAQANPHGSLLRDGDAVTAIFNGPNAYVAPAWYTTREAVPTWNYIVVHARGRIRLTHDSADKEKILKALIDRHDPPYRVQWDALGEEFREKMKRAIVGLAIEDVQLEGKFKLGQNRPQADRDAVRAMHGQRDAQAQLLAQWMQRLGL